jgi:probable F420-dependent oxidoreductase
MQFGFLSLNTVEGIRPDTLARELEDRGFDSFWVPEHSHIPTDRRTPYAMKNQELPEGYWHMMDPFVALSMAATSTTTLKLYTGICLLLEHDLLALTVTTATLDALSGGRLHLGVGVGWNEEELANHRPDLPFGQRYSAMRERVAAMRTAWREERPSFEGRWDRFEESWIYPKPAGGTIPVALGNAGPVGVRHAVEYADEWCPIDVALHGPNSRPDPVGRLAEFRAALEEAGRDPDSVPVTFHCILGPRPGDLERYAEAGVERVVLFPEEMVRHDEATTLKRLDSFMPMVEEWRS